MVLLASFRAKQNKKKKKRKEFLGLHWRYSLSFHCRGQGFDPWLGN